MNIEEIKILIQESMIDAEIIVNSDDNVHFEAIIISDEFINKTSIQRHQMIYQSLGNKMDSEIHALSIKTLTKEENK
ncbi:MAG: BolA/IbaG family iron-sulfur metabolism protein [Gammaproteobacteria bacterium]|jgi:acid stress-induced BolA-like protein IbaG/YrbA|nr:BolA/IbaG family iron-sulfur metabolism protein [Gammaproteobacteria bacterium]MBT6074385.1 BolA/IbaG family iron-sulfur metabolism protein [Gammaproteobacteria bacterium]MBT7753883.1 BolA/IbaG family iron-sulfur metabolism protein [Gammaproteobacteria bacterium]MDG2435362.1 BolA/IbaG family iron-sulfur metabolism protein [Gammaproteobacteria bacterium]